MPNRTLLVPLDGSEFSRQVLPEIQRLFPADRYDVEILHVATPPTGFPEPLAETATYADEALYVWPAPTPTPHPIHDTAELDHYRQGLLQRLEADAYPLRQAGYDTEVRVVFGSPVEAILRAIDSDDIDLVVMGTHGRTAVARFFVGSVSHDVQRLTDAPVLLIKLEDEAAGAGDEATEEQPSIALGNATLGGIRGVGVATVLRSVNGSIIEIGGSWHQPGDPTALPFMEGEKVIYLGPIEEARSGVPGAPGRGIRRARVTAVIRHATTLNLAGRGPVQLVNFRIDPEQLEAVPVKPEEEHDGLAADRTQLDRVSSALSDDLRTHRRS